MPVGKVTGSFIRSRLTGHRKWLGITISSTGKSGTWFCFPLRTRRRTFLLVQDRTIFMGKIGLY
uniref:Uncharacterized protein n=1 Tax=Lotus japonicus TaxID=34305 RepID=I3SZF2_LOTJA|nr:unknown [Lotus japonicus]